MKLQIYLMISDHSDDYTNNLSLLDKQNNYILFIEIISIYLESKERI
jgi:hypothetical protein